MEFTSYVSSETGPRFLLTDLGDGSRSGWLGIGGSFRGYTLARFDLEDKSVSMRKEAETLQLALKQSKTGNVAAVFLEDKTISVSDDLDFFIGDLAVDANTLTELIRVVIRAQPEGPVELELRWTNPGASNMRLIAKNRMAADKLNPVLKGLGEEGRRLQVRLPVSTERP